MLTINQAVGLIISISLTIMVMFIGYQIVLILKEIHTGLKRINHVIDKTSSVVESVAEPVRAVSGLFTGIRAGTEVFRSFSKAAQPRPSRSSKDE